MTPFRARRFEGLIQSDIRRMTLECRRVGGLNLAQGLCDLPVPPAVQKAAEAAIRARTNTYSVAAGVPELRRALAAKLRRDNGLEADPEREIVVTAGVTGAYFSTLYALLDPGDGVLLFEPYYGYHWNIARVAGMQPHALSLDPPPRRPCARPCVPRRAPSSCARRRTPAARCSTGRRSRPSPGSRTSAICWS